MQAQNVATGLLHGTDPAQANRSVGGARTVCTCCILQAALEHNVVLVNGEAQAGTACTDCDTLAGHLVGKGVRGRWFRLCCCRSSSHGTHAHGLHAGATATTVVSLHYSTPTAQIRIYNAVQQRAVCVPAVA